MERLKLSLNDLSRVYAIFLRIYVNLLRDDVSLFILLSSRSCHFLFDRLVLLLRGYTMAALSARSPLLASLQQQHAKSSTPRKLIFRSRAAAKVICRMIPSHSRYLPETCIR